MRNVLSMDLYRMKKTKSTYILFFIYVAFLALFLLLLKTSIDSGLMETELTVSDFVYNMLCGNSTIFLLVIFIAMFINAEFNSGYYKNIMGDIPKKVNYVVSKCVIVAIYTAIYVIVGFVMAIVGARILNYTDWGEIGKLMGYVGIVYLLDFVLGIIMVMVTIALRNSAASTSIGVVYILLVASLLYSLINYAVDKIFAVEDFLIQEYLPYGNLITLSPTNLEEGFVRGIIVAVIFGAIAFIGSVQIVKRRDV